MPRNSLPSPSLLTNAAATGASQYFPGGDALFVLVAGNGGATTALQVLGPDGVTWVPIAGTASATTVAVSLKLPEGNYRAAVTGGTAPTGIHAQIRGIL